MSGESTLFLYLNCNRGANLLHFVTLTPKLPQ